MHSSNNLSSLRRALDNALADANQLLVRGDYAGAEAVCVTALKQWRGASGPKMEESKIIGSLGKCYEAQRKYELAHDLYMEALPNLQGQAYDDVYTSLLYLNERMGTFTKKQNDGFNF
jgi:tetratricopeptide (TPR) repeat protein